MLPLIYSVGGSGTFEIPLLPGLVIPPGTGSAVSLSNQAELALEQPDLSPPLDPDGNLLVAC